ncbi:MAG: metal ABC transporter permease [Planctomycetes bacterium]|nr:metal ABC transporter permease [Planctomycetota bacterium]HON45373.1 metal ABC transporter permease [Planctomycetota bacterium]HRU51496.1 metal ABC transporter permease [Planctomycetota bacterium]
MNSLHFIYQIIPTIFPWDCMQSQFMQKALVALLLLAPMVSAMGVQVVNFRMAFFSDAISHSAFAGLALGILLNVHPHTSMPLFAVLVGLVIMYMQRQSRLSSDTIIGVFFSAVIAFGLAVVSRNQSISRNMQQFLYGDILTIQDRDIYSLIMLFIGLLIFQIVSYNKMLYIGLNPTLAHAHKVKVARYQYIFAALLSLIVIFSVWAVGVFLVTALMIIPAATARNVAKSAGTMFWWAIFLSLVSTISGLILSAQPWARTATGATIVLISFVFFIISQIFNRIR